ncbi:hypothetical protein LSAT2_024479, partial [Lamellibrachia satsuma]
VQAVIRGCPDEQGISVNNIAQKLRGLPPQSLKEAIEFLSGEGHIYSTVDDEHYRSTDAIFTKSLANRSLTPVSLRPERSTSSRKPQKKRFYTKFKTDKTRRIESCGKRSGHPPVASPLNSAMSRGFRLLDLPTKHSGGHQVVRYSRRPPRVNWRHTVDRHSQLVSRRWSDFRMLAAGRSKWSALTAS